MLHERSIGNNFHKIEPNRNLVKTYLQNDQ